MSIELKYNDLEYVESKKVYEQLPEFTRIAKYAQYNHKKKRRETWNEQVDRVFKMHKVKLSKYIDNEEFIKETFMNLKGMHSVLIRIDHIVDKTKIINIFPKIISKAINLDFFTEEDIFFHNERWHCFDVHSDVSNDNK